MAEHAYIELQDKEDDRCKGRGGIFSFLRRSNEVTEEAQQRILNYDRNGEYIRPESMDEGSFIGNKIKTSKYSMFTFLPLNLFEQIIRPANFYFVIIAALQSVPAVSATGGTPTILLPLTFVFTVTAIKDALEDWKRHRDDKRVNQRLIEIKQNDASFITKRSQDIQVGEIVRIEDRQRFPADLLLICSARGHDAPFCYVETSNIDGETNLKLKQSAEGLNTLKPFDNQQSIQYKSSFEEFKRRMKRSSILCEAPNGHLDSWNGLIRDLDVPNVGQDDEKEEVHILAEEQTYDARNVHLSSDNLLLRGSELRNSDFIYGLVIYAGFDCKIFMNNKSRETKRIKRSSVEKTVGKFIFYMAIIQFFMCLLCAILSGVWTTSNQNAWYLYQEIAPKLDAFYKFFTWFIIFAQFIPISLLVSMETVKFIQAHFMEWDIKMYTRLRGKTDKFCTVQNSNLNEELGQIEFVFSDKTGTLTENSLDFRKCVIGNRNYGRGETEIGRAAKQRQQELKQSDEDGIKLKRAYTADVGVALERNNNFPHVNFDEEAQLRKQLKLSCINTDTDPDMNAQSMMVRRFLTVLAINNSCYPVSDAVTGQLSIRAASPDDECLTCFAQFIGVQLTQRKPPCIKLNIFPDGLANAESQCQENWEQLAELPFTSKRKRMSVIARNLQTGNIHFTMKGADSEMMRLIHDWKGDDCSKYVEKYIEEYSEQGLRTLIVAEAIFDSEWWDDAQTGWFHKYVEFEQDTLIMEETEKGHIKGICGNACRKCKWYERIERAAKCQLLGCTAIEDKLQESVPETISAMLDGGINVWVLTGDKQKTAENIGIACNLLEPAMEKHGLLFKLTVANVHKLQETMSSAIDAIVESRQCQPQASGLVINSKALISIMDNAVLQSLFLELGKLCKSVIGVRLQPNQKAQIIEFIQQRTGARTLAIGDGSNDEPMIRTASVGVGIAGLEGTAAVRASDYSIGKFKFLKRLLFVHGRLNYKRISTLICYMFYKNGLLALSSFFFGFCNGFSGVKPYSEWPFQLYNIVFTCVPILLFAVIDRDYSDEYLISHPQLYKYGQTCSNLNTKVFFVWIIESWMASLLLTFLPLYCYVYNTAVDSTGQSAGIWTVGIVILTSIVITANLRLSFVTNTWMWLTHIFLWGSIVAYFLSMMIVNSTTFFGYDIYWIVFRAMGTSRYWLTVLVATIVALYIPATYVTFTTLRKKAKRKE